MLIACSHNEKPHTNTNSHIANESAKPATIFYGAQHRFSISHTLTHANIHTHTHTLVWIFLWVYFCQTGIIRCSRRCVCVVWINGNICTTRKCDVVLCGQSLIILPRMRIIIIIMLPLTRAFCTIGWMMMMVCVLVLLLVGYGCGFFGRTRTTVVRGIRTPQQRDYRLRTVLLFRMRASLELACTICVCESARHEPAKKKLKTARRERSVRSSGNEHEGGESRRSGCAARACVACVPRAVRACVCVRSNRKTGE